MALAARRKDRLDELAERINADGGTALAFEADVGDEAQARAFVERAAEELGGLDFLVNNAGVMLLGPVEGADTEQWRRMVDVNVLGLLYCTQAALPLIRDSGGGHIVNVSSVAGPLGELGVGRLQPHQVGGGGLLGGAAPGGAQLEHPRHRVEPGFVDTELQGHNEHPMVVEATEKMQRRDRQGARGRDIARAILYVVSQPEHVNINEVLIRPTGQRALRTSHRIRDVRDTVRSSASRRQPNTALSPQSAPASGPCASRWASPCATWRERSGVSAPMLSQVERGEASPTLAVATRIAAGLDLTLSQLLRLDEDRHLVITRRGRAHARPRAATASRS